MVCVDSQVIAQLELWNERNSSRYERKVYVLPKHLDEKVALLHLPRLGCKLTKLTPEQSAYINIPANGPYKPAHYRCGIAAGMWCLANLSARTHDACSWRTLLSLINWCT